jgi:hypothetical protein
MWCINRRRPSRKFFCLQSVRHPCGALIEEDLQGSSSVYDQVRHPRGAFIEEDLQESSSVPY